MIKFFRNLSFKNKLLSVQIFSSICGLLLAVLVLLVFEISEFKKHTRDDLSAMAELIGNRSTAALLFDDPSLAKENLSSLEQLSVFQTACIYHDLGQVFTSVKLNPLSENLPCSEQYNRSGELF